MSFKNKISYFKIVKLNFVIWFSIQVYPSQCLNVCHHQQQQQQVSNFQHNIEPCLHPRTMPFRTKITASRFVLANDLRFHSSGLILFRFQGHGACCCRSHLFHTEEPRETSIYETQMNSICHFGNQPQQCEHNGEELYSSADWNHVGNWISNLLT